MSQSALSTSTSKFSMCTTESNVSLRAFCSLVKSSKGSASRLMQLKSRSFNTQGPQKSLRRERTFGTRIQAAGQWLESSAQLEVPVPLEEAWVLWEDRARIPQWMPWITSVTVFEDNPQLSRWTLSTYQFNQQWEFSWIAQNLTPLRHQKIHWRSVPGSSSGSLGSLEVQNRGQIRFLRKGSSSCQVKLTISYEVPTALAPFANLLTPVVEGILQKDMERFADYATKNSRSAVESAD